MHAMGTLYRRIGGSLTRRTAVVSLLLSAVIGAAFFLLALAIDELRMSETRANHEQQVRAGANRLERLIIDVDATQRGFFITGDPQFLRAWYHARAEFPGQAAAFEQLARSGDAGLSNRAAQITAAGRSYIRDYSVPLVALARRDLNAARTVQVTEQGRHLTGAIRSMFTQFMARERQVNLDLQQRSDAAARHAVVAASASVAGSVILILFSGGYLTRSVVLPIRRAAATAGRVADGDLTVRTPEAGPAEVGRLARSLNIMTDSLVSGRDELRQAADEQAALRRVATLVARGLPPSTVFDAVAAETGSVLGAAATAVTRFEPDGSATVVGSWGKSGRPGSALPAESHWPAGETHLVGRVQRTGQPAWVFSNDTKTGAGLAWAQEHGIHCAVGTPIVVQQRIWGAITAFCDSPFCATVAPRPQDTEQRLLAFTELVAMAVANAESRAQVAASRARVVAAADDARRRIERDLHDGIQQRLISLALDLRAAEFRATPGQAAQAALWSRTAQGLTEVVEELREISRGLHPAILEQGGLWPALRALSRRSSLPVELAVRIRRRLPEPVEAAVYYVVSEALTNVAKHAHATAVSVDVGIAGADLRLLVSDDGTGGADASGGSGLVGLSDRVEAAGGQIDISSPVGGGTTLAVTIPLGQSGRDGTAGKATGVGE